MVVAAYLPKEVINKTQKLVLMKICDSADDQTRLGRPGLERMMAWAGVGEKQVITVVTELVELGLVERSQTGQIGRRAEYRVFPQGVPPVPTTEELIERRRLAQRAPKNPRLARTEVRRRKPSAPARTQQDVVARKEERPSDRNEESGFPQGNPAGGEKRVSPGEPSGFPQGNQEGSPRETPFLPSPSYSLPYPPTPTAAAAGEPDAAADQRGCPRHERPVANCRGCGTNPRAGREQARREAAAGEHRSQQEWLREFLAEQQRRRAEADDGAVAKARAQARAGIRKRPGPGANSP